MKKQGKKTSLTIPEIEQEIDNDRTEGDFQNYHLQDDDDGRPAPKAKSRSKWLVLVMAFILGLVAYLGFMLLTPNRIELKLWILAVSYMIILVGFLYLFTFGLKIESPLKRVMGFLMWIILGAVSLYIVEPTIWCIIFCVIVGLLSLLLSAFSFLNAWRQKKDQFHNGKSIWVGLIYFAVGIALLIWPSRIHLLRILTGMFLFLFGLDRFIYAVTALLGAKGDYSTRITFSLPIALAGFIPVGYFSWINNLVRYNKKELKDLEQPDNNGSPDMIIYIHTRAGIIPGFGHCDILFDGQVYSYGDYDNKSIKLQGLLADGVMGLIPPQRQIEFAEARSKKILIAFGLRLTNKDKEQVRKRIKQIMSQSYYWKSDAERAQDGEIPGPPERYNDIASQMYLIEHTQFYKFKSGSNYKTYYGMGMNCVELVNDIVTATGLELINFNGMISPGNYLEYLDSLYLLGNSKVIERRLYRIENHKAEEIPGLENQPIRLSQMSM